MYSISIQQKFITYFRFDWSAYYIQFETRFYNLTLLLLYSALDFNFTWHTELHILCLFWNLTYYQQCFLNDLIYLLFSQTWSMALLLLNLLYSTHVYIYAFKNLWDKEFLMRADILFNLVWLLIIFNYFWTSSREICRMWFYQREW